MRVVHVAPDGALELNFMWLPSFIGQNYIVLRELEAAWKERYPDGLPNDESSLDDIHNYTIDWLCNKFKVFIGLKQYLKGIENIEQEGDHAVQQVTS